MNAIHQISLKLQLGIDPASNIQSEQLLQKWKEFSAHRCHARAQQRTQLQHTSNPPGSESLRRAS